MDTVTQIVLGAAVGEATLGKKVGNKSLLWGAIGGILPDLDILAYPVLDPVGRMAFHRGVSHSLIFALILAPLLGYLIFTLYRGKHAGWAEWSRLVFWSIVTHPLLDIFTTYGTQFFWPFSDVRISLNSIFVIDPVYSLPFFLLILSVFFFKRDSKKRRILNYTGLTLSTVYLVFTLVNKQLINNVFAVNLDKYGIKYIRLHSTPTPFNNFLWRGLVETDQGFYEGYYSWFDDNNAIDFKFIEKNHHLIQDLQDHQDIKTLKWISNNFYTISKKAGALYFNDMRYGQINGWHKGDSEFIFSFRIEEPGENNGNFTTITRERGSVKIDRLLLINFLKRIIGNL